MAIKKYIHRSPELDPFYQIQLSVLALLVEPYPFAGKIVKCKNDWQGVHVEFEK